MSKNPTRDERPCPTCKKPLETREYGEVTLDFCVEHGIWFDTGEFDELLRRSAGSGQKNLQRRKRNATKSGFFEGISAGFDRARELRGSIFERTGPRIRRRARGRRRDRPQPAALPKIALVEYGERLCPCCAEPMNVDVWKDLFKATPDVTVDLCPDHGLWLDHGEMEVLLERARLDAGRDGRAKVSRSNWKGFEHGLNWDLFD